MPYGALMPDDTSASTEFFEALRHDGIQEEARFTPALGCRRCWPRQPNAEKCMSAAARETTAQE